MANKSIFCALLMAVLVSSLAFSCFGRVDAALSISKPSVPTFTLKYIDNSHDVPSVSGIDPYTGKETVTQAGYYIQEKIIELAIKNPDFHGFTDADGHEIRLYYSIQARPHFDGSWFYLVGAYYGEDAHYIGADSDSPYTTLQYGIVGNNDSVGLRCLDIPAGGSIDFQVKAFIGYNTRISEGMTIFGEVYHYVFTGEASDWSDTQTLVIKEESPVSTSNATPTSTVLPSQNPTSTYSQNISVSEENLDWLQVATLVLLAVIAVLLALAVFYLRRRSLK